MNGEKIKGLVNEYIRLSQTDVQTARNILGEENFKKVLSRLPLEKRRVLQK